MKKSRLAAIILCVVMIISAIPAYASSVEESELDYAIQRASSALAKNGYQEVDEIVICEPIPQYNLESGEVACNIYLLFDGDTHIGMVLITNVNGQRYATTTIRHDQIIENAMEMHSEIGFARGYNCSFAYIDGVWSILKNPLEVEIDVESLPILSNTTQIAIADNISIQLGRFVYHDLMVPIVANRMNPYIEDDDEAGLCWAASLASKIGYQKDIDLTAMDVFNKCWDSVDHNLDELPTGVPEWYKKGARLYGLSVTQVTGAPSPERIASRLSRDIPLIMGMTYMVRGTWTFRHAVVLCGIEEDIDVYELKIMDPNERSYQYCTLPKGYFDGDDDFYYISDGVTFNYWTYTFY